MENKKINTKTLVIVSMLGAIAALLMFIEISLPFAPTFVKFDISDLPVLISGFLFGPFLGVLTAVIKIIIKRITLARDFEFKLTTVDCDIDIIQQRK